MLIHSRRVSSCKRPVILMYTRRSDAAAQRLSRLVLLLRKRLPGLDPCSFTPELAICYNPHLINSQSRELYISWTSHLLNSRSPEHQISWQIRTGDGKDAGTDGPIKMEMQGTNGWCDKVDINSERNDFRRGAWVIVSHHRVQKRLMSLPNNTCSVLVECVFVRMVSYTSVA